MTKVNDRKKKYYLYYLSLKTVHIFVLAIHELLFDIGGISFIIILTKNVDILIYW